ncbi:hypothetical protein AOCH_004555 [Aspergillus ochraceoroseus]|uniref:Transcription factor RfeG n=1 Tax=Aspergillus ochraceoroseus TaxID=138278 RepID=A0A0F8XNX3_9EURO|nr:hypothetical protein AOCH_004555 [Aspergillus ochraceoroseus]
MTGRHGAPFERQNEYFIAGDGISREVIQADICRYLGNDALEMIADLKADSARWEADVRSRADQANYSSAHPEMPQGQGPSPPTTYAAPPQQYAEQYPPSGYPATSTPPYTNAPSYPPNHSGAFGAGQNPYPPPHVPYSAPGQPAVTADMHPSYTYASSGYGYENGRNNAPRYPGPGYEAESDYSPVTTGMAYPTTTAPDPRIAMEPRYTPESTYPDRNRPQPAREREAQRRTR